MKNIRYVHKKDSNKVGIILITQYSRDHLIVKDLLEHLNVYIQMGEATKEIVHNAILEQVSMLGNGKPGKD